MWLHVSGYTLIDPVQTQRTIEIMKIGSDLHIPISLDTGLDPVLKQQKAFLKAARCSRVIISGIEEGKALFNTTEIEKICTCFHQLGPEWVAIKMGEQGSILSDGTALHSIQPFNVQAVDTTGAGDAYSAGLIFGHIHGLKPTQAGLAASVLSALAITCSGAGGNLPGKEDLVEFLRERLKVNGKDIPGEEMHELLNLFNQ